MRWFLLLVFGASLLAGLGLLLRGAEQGAGGEGALALEGPTGPAVETDERPVRRPAGLGAVGPGPEGGAAPDRGEIAPDAAFEEEMRSRYAAMSIAALGQAFQKLRQQVGLQAMEIGQPLIQVSGVELGEVNGLAPDILIYRGPDAERRMRAVVLSREDYPALTYKHREAVWLQTEISRRQRE